MARPRIFVSSTFYDLKHIRSSIEQFIESLGFEAVLSEKGSIAYDPDIPLDESCYREARHSDIFVLIIGGRYGSTANNELSMLKTKDVPHDFFERYSSITKREYDSAVERDIPIYILIDTSVYTEYETFKKNRHKEDISYAHVDSVNVFLLIDDILKQTRNNPIHQFDRHAEISSWLREQWSGLFKELLANRSEHRQLVCLSEQVEGLLEINTTLKRYLEEIIPCVSNQETANELIRTEEQRIAESQMMKQFAKHAWVKEITRMSKFVTVKDVCNIFLKAESIEDFAKLLEELDSEQYPAERFLRVWQNKNTRYAQKMINDARQLLGLQPINFTMKEC